PTCPCAGAIRVDYALCFQDAGPSSQLIWTAVLAPLRFTFCRSASTNSEPDQPLVGNGKPDKFRFLKSLQPRESLSVSKADSLFAGTSFTFSTVESSSSALKVETGTGAC